MNGAIEPKELTMAVRFELKEFGTSFATRGRGEEVREALTSRIGDSDRIVVDIAGVTHMSYSFADELLGKLGAASDVSLSIVGASPSLSRTIAEAVRRREPAPSSC